MDAEFARDLEDYVRVRGARLVRTAYLLTGDNASAEDAVQAALASIIVSWRRIRHVVNLDAYMTRSVVNASRRSWRRKSGELLTASPPDRSVPDESVRYDVYDEVLAALREIPPGQRAAVVLRYYDDLSEVETARVLGCSVGAVKSQASRGLAKLRALLDMPEPDTGSRKVG